MQAFAIDDGPNKRREAALRFKQQQLEDKRKQEEAEKRKNQPAKPVPPVARSQSETTLTQEKQRLISSAAAALAQRKTATPVVPVSSPPSSPLRQQHQRSDGVLEVKQTGRSLVFSQGMPIHDMPAFKYGVDTTRLPRPDGRRGKRDDTLYGPEWRAESRMREAKTFADAMYRFTMDVSGQTTAHITIEKLWAGNGKGADAVEFIVRNAAREDPQAYSNFFQKHYNLDKAPFIKAQETMRTSREAAEQAARDALLTPAQRDLIEREGYPAAGNRNFTPDQIRALERSLSAARPQANAASARRPNIAATQATSPVFFPATPGAGTGPASFGAASAPTATRSQSGTTGSTVTPKIDDPGDNTFEDDEEKGMASRTTTPLTRRSAGVPPHRAATGGGAEHGIPSLRNNDGNNTSQPMEFTPGIPASSAPVNQSGEPEEVSADVNGMHLAALNSPELQLAYLMYNEKTNASNLQAWDLL
jgi:hypothetical protein